MLVFLRQRLVVLATPRAASTALHMALAGQADLVTRGVPAIKHVSLARWHRQWRPLLEDYAGGPLETCALIRAPLDWLDSWRRYRSVPALDGSDRSTAGRSFEAFAEAWLAPRPPPYARVADQAGFLSLPGAAAGGVDHLWRYEALEGFADWLSGRLDRPVRLRRVNAAPPGPPPQPDPALRARLEAALARDLALHAAARH